MTFEDWWVEKQGTPPRPTEQKLFDYAREAWNRRAEIAVAAELEQTDKLRIQLQGALRERDEAVRKAQRHEELRRQYDANREQTDKLRIQFRGALRERDDAVQRMNAAVERGGEAERKAARHEELRRQTEVQCDRLREQKDPFLRGKHKGEVPLHSPRGPKMKTLYAVAAEVVRARKKHPGNAHLLAALTEEVGKLAQALLEDQGEERVRSEAMQCACVAIRIMEEGDSDFE